MTAWGGTGMIQGGSCTITVDSCNTTRHPAWDTARYYSTVDELGEVWGVRRGGREFTGHDWYELYELVTSLGNNAAGR